MNLFKTLAIGFAASCYTLPVHTAEITGAGSTFAAPVYAQWAHAYRKASGVKVNYQGIGSSAGLKQIIAKTVDFAASDTPLTANALSKAGLLQFPTIAGGVVPVVNVPGIQPGEMVLSGQVLGDIYLGKITNGTTLKSSNSIRRCTHAPGCPISRLPWCGARTARAPARSGPIIYRRPTRNGKRPLAKAQPSAGRRASGEKEMTASPPSLGV